MKYILYITLAALVMLSACSSEPLFPEVNDTNDTYVSVELNTSVDVEPEREPETVTELEPAKDDKYAAQVVAVEGDLIELETRATDPDGDDVTLSFSEPFDDDGTWQTQLGDAGQYEVTVVASDGKDETAVLILVVIDSANGAPTIQGPNTIRVKEGEIVDLGVLTITDPENDEFVVSYAGWMDSSEKQTSFNDAGEFTVRVIAEDENGNVAQHIIAIEVENVNRKPILNIEERTVSAIEGEKIVIDASAQDPDGEDVEITFEAPFDQNGIWQTTEGDAGTYTVSVTASDGQEQVSRTVRVTITQANRPPVIEFPNTITVKEGETIDLEAVGEITDPEGEDVQVTYSGWMSTSTYTTTFEDAGEYEVTISASDGQAESEETISIVVENVNRAPVFIRSA